ncbi:uncharacterized protein RHOBADRAFT_54943 [Rhodotorula graminis WP1]|uniref:Uncharacterized protein n=1 Tax=Rhodotorula graminis (strain WP1) TaxID=578459 RepID=A0A0P9F228_RHOGW|nr:uncharacterized protein RHOBADRAFT_54943 [Rhodotorula graminis WP1]KPV73761.1 hypothetical protein RHOBADRAFT_54943 [Rhodotorula graminis WP1]
MVNSIAERYSFLGSEPPRRARDGSAALPLVQRGGAEQRRRGDTSRVSVEGAMNGARGGRAVGEHGQDGVGVARRDGENRRARATSTSSVATCASVDDGLFSALVAAFPSPPVEGPMSPGLDSPSSATGSRGSRRPSLPPPCPPPRAPLPPLPTSSTSSRADVAALSSTRKAPPLPLPPTPPSASIVHVGLGIDVSRPYTLSSKHTSTSAQKPLPPLPVASGSPTSPRFRRLPPTPPPARPGLVEHPFAPPPIPKTYGDARTRTYSTSSGSSRSSLDLGNITADLSELAESFARMGPSAASGRQDGLGGGDVRDVEEERGKERLGEKEEDEDEDEEEQRALVRRVQSLIELQRRKASVASSVGGRSASVASEAGSALTTGGYRAYKLTHRSSFLPPSPTTTRRRRRRRTTSSTSSSSTSTSDSEAEFDLSLDTPATSPALERDGFGWTTMRGVGGRYGRRQSSATTIESVGGGGGGGKGEQGWGPHNEQDDEVEVLASPVTRRSASSAPIPAPSVGRRALPTTRSHLAPPPSSALPRPSLSNARASPSLRRPALPVPSSSPAAPPHRRPSASAPPTLPLPPVPVLEPDPATERRTALPQPHAVATATATASASRLRPLVTASSARLGPSASPAVSRLPALQRLKPLLASSTLRPPQPVGAPSTVARAPGARTAPAEGARAARHGRRSSLQMLPYLVTEQEGLSAARDGAVRLPRR